MKNKILILMLGLVPLQTFGFDLEDYATTYRAARDAYLKAQNELALAKWPFEAAFAYAKKFEDACFEQRGYKTAHFQGLFDGSCAKDGELPHVTGGPKWEGTKLGDKLELLINSLPMTVSLMPLEDSFSKYRAYRDAAAKYWNEVELAKGGIYEIPGCVPKDTQFNRLIKDAFVRVENDAGPVSNWSSPKERESWIHNNVLQYVRLLPSDIKNEVSGQYDLEDYGTTLRATRDAFFKAINELTLATGPYLAAKEAYQSATAVYVSMIRCENSGYSRRGHSVQDPYDWP